jgi:UDP-glucuronate 4-epimerase
MTVLVTGAAGFIGYHVSQRLLERGIPVVGFDSLTPYYDPALKRARLSRLEAVASHQGIPFVQIHADLCDPLAVGSVFRGEAPDGSVLPCGGPSRVVHLAAQAGVRHSLQNPEDYIQSNLVGFNHVLECCRRHGIAHFVYASSSSVYGGNTQLPFRESQSVDHPVSLYAATKKANELMAHAASHLHGLPATGLRFFTVYGPWGRPDMALFLFTKAILAGEPIDVFNHGRMVRDFTYIDDVVEAVTRVLDKPATPDCRFDSNQPAPEVSWAPHRLFNVGNAKPTPLLEYIEALEQALGIQAQKRFLPLQPGDVPCTAADTTALEAWIGFHPSTSVHEGVHRFVTWYRQYYGC